MKTTEEMLEGFRIAKKRDQPWGIAQVKALPDQRMTVGAFRFSLVWDVRKQAFLVSAEQEGDKYSTRSRFYIRPPRFGAEGKWTTHFAKKDRIKEIGKAFGKPADNLHRAYRSGAVGFVRHISAKMKARRDNQDYGSREEQG